MIRLRVWRPVVQRPELVISDGALEVLGSFLWCRTQNGKRRGDEEKETTHCSCSLVL